MSEIDNDLSMTVAQVKAELDKFPDNFCVVFKNPHCYDSVQGVRTASDSGDSELVERHTGYSGPIDRVVIIWGD